jgi:hypothetical protein
MFPSSPPAQSTFDDQEGRLLRGLGIRRHPKVDNAGSNQRLAIGNVRQTEMEVPVRGTLIPLAPEATLGCNACYTDWSLHQQENDTVLQFEEWKAARAAWRTSVDAKPPYEACVCATAEKTVLTNRTVPRYDNLGKACPVCYTAAARVIKTYAIDMDSVEDNARALRLFIGMRGVLGVQLERYPNAADCPCAARMSAYLPWWSGR